MLGVFNGEGQNVTANADSTLLWVGRATVRPVAYLTLGANFARYGSDSTRYGVDAQPRVPWAPRSRASTSASIATAAGSTTRAGTPRAPIACCPGCSSCSKQEDFRRSAISEALRNRATTGGVNVEFGGGKVRLLANYVSRKIGTPGTRQGMLITQAQVKF